VKRSKLFSMILTGLVSSTSMAAPAGNYCAAIRGNGELMPAHWGAISSLVEDQGLPSAMAGGSSASITMFLLESLSVNSLLKNKSETALMIKSFQGYFEALTQTEEGKSLQSLFADKAAFQLILASGGKIDEALKSPASSALLSKHLESLKVLMASKDLKSLINPDFALYVQRTTMLSQQTDPAVVAVYKYRSGQISHALKNFGKFNAQTDKTLFFRPGLINFEGLAQNLGKMADFYANYNNNSPAGKQIEERIQQFLAACAPGTQNLSWRQINEQRPVCRQLLGSAVLMYRAADTGAADRQSRADELVGSHIPAYATTSVLTGEAVEKYSQLYVEYQKNADENFGDQLTMSQDNLKFGYWGQEADLANVASKFSSESLYKNDAKSQKFLSLGSTPWSEVLATSPAEPGLSRIVAINQQQLSAGGWSDLHPTLILKAHGCENIIYVTRKGEESKFAQGVFKRLTNADEQTSRQFFDMNNSQSSISRSYQNATQIKCTNWDKFDVKKDMNGLVEEAMQAPLINPPNCK